MKLPADTVKNLTKIVREKGIAEDVDGENGQKLRVFFLEDITTSFLLNEKPTFFGISFEAIGREFTILQSLDLLVSLPEENEEGEAAYEINDEKTMGILNEYLVWRTKALETVGI